MDDMCNDNRFELIEKYKKRLIEATNIETASDEMAVIDNILFRFWQMGWLDKLEQHKCGKWINTRPSDMSDNIVCSECGYDSMVEYLFCPNCGARMGERREDE